MPLIQDRKKYSHSSQETMFRMYQKILLRMFLEGI